MFPNIRLLFAALFGSVVTLGCGFALFAKLGVSHEPLSRPPSASTPLHFVTETTAANAKNTLNTKNTWGAPFGPQPDGAQNVRSAADAPAIGPGRPGGVETPNGSTVGPELITGAIPAHAAAKNPAPAASPASRLEPEIAEHARAPEMALAPAPPIPLSDADPLPQPEHVQATPVADLPVAAAEKISPPPIEPAAQTALVGAPVNIAVAAPPPPPAQAASATPDGAATPQAAIPNVTPPDATPPAQVEGKQPARIVRPALRRPVRRRHVATNAPRKHRTAAHRIARANNRGADAPVVFITAPPAQQRVMRTAKQTRWTAGPLSNNDP
jgi:hypothetical protein